jgi:LPS-assembly protein
VRHRVGIAYQNECVDLGLTWQREYQTFGDARRGSSFLVRLAFRNLGI